MNPIVAPSLLASDFANLQREVTMINESEAEWIHIDIMDGVFVPNLSIGIPVVEAIRRHARKIMDVHLMIIDPRRYIRAFREAGADIISIHIETCPHLNRDIQEIKASGAKAGVAINPHTPVLHLENCIADIDVVNLMSVNPGYGGQQFLDITYEKIRQTAELIKAKGSSALIEIDGGVTLDNARAILAAGANVLVAGHTVFSGPNPKGIISKLRNS